MQKLYYHGDIITMKSELDYAEGILVEDGIIKKVGMLYEIEPMCKTGVELINLGGKTLMPAFIDAHSHISMVAQLSQMADLSMCKSFNDIIKTLKNYIKEKNISEGEVIFGFGYDHTILKEEMHPTKELLNQVSTKYPIFISHVSGHMGCANDKALELAGITSDTKEGSGGVIGRVAGTKEPNGYLEEEEALKLQKKLGKVSNFNLEKALIEAQEYYLKNGITTVQDGASTKELIEEFIELAQKDKWKIDIVSYLLLEESDKEGLTIYPNYVKQYQNRFKIGGYKIILDGSPQAKSAWLTKPYEGEKTYCGYPRLKEETVKTYIRRAIEENQQLLAHCNGDAASDQYLRNYEEQLKHSHNPNKYNLRPVMIHCQTIRDDQLDKMKELNMIPSMFIAHTYYWGDIHLKNLGNERGNRISPAKSAMERGLVLNFHQDAPIVKPLMMHTVWCAVNRLTRTGKAIGLNQRINVFEALKAVTIYAAYAYGEENQKGTLETGKLADFVILNKNPLKVKKAQLREIEVLETIKEGISLYQKEA